MFCLDLDYIVGDIQVRASCEYGLFTKGRGLSFVLFLFSSNNLIDGIGEFLLLSILVKGDMLFIKEI